MTLGNTFSKKGLKEIKFNHLQIITFDEMVKSNRDVTNVTNPKLLKELRRVFY